MKPATIAKRMLSVLSIALLLGLFALIFGHSKIDTNSLSGAKDIWTNVALARETASASVQETAQPNQDKIKEELYPGSRMKTETAVQKASLIIVGKFLDHGIRSFDSPDRVIYSGAKVEVLQILKGYVSAELSLNFEVHDYSRDMKEKEPEVGQRYIIFIREKTGVSIKFLPDTEEQRWHITELVSSAANKDR